MAMYNVLIDGTNIYEIRPAYKTPSNVFELDPTGIINSGDDLDDYTDFGCWLSPSTTVTNTLKNCPVTGGGFSIRVMRGTGGASYRVQEMIIWSGQRFFRAQRAGNWDAWKTDIGITKLWENASPTSDFNNQNISLPLSNFDSAMILFERDKNLRVIPPSIVPVGTAAAAEFSTSIRLFSVLGTGVNFTSSTSPSEVIPVKIYGITGIK